MADRELMKLVRRVDDLERMSLAQNLPQMANSSIEDGFVEEYTAEGTVASRIGRQEDGTHAPTTLSGPTPPTPAGITAEGGQLTASLTWDGSYSDSLVSMMDFSRAEVHGSTDSPDFTPDPLPASATRIATIETAGGASVTFAAASGTLYLKVIVRSLAGRWSEPSDVVTVEVQQAVDPAVLDQLQDELDEATQHIADAQDELDQAKALLAQGEIIDRTNLLPNPGRSVLAPWDALTPSGGAGTVTLQVPTQYPVGGPTTGKVLRRSWTTVPPTPWNSGTAKQSHGDIYWNQQGTAKVTAGATYTVSAWVRSGTAIKALIGSEFRNASNAVVGSTPFSAPVQLPVWAAAADWVRISHTFTVPAGAVDVRAQFHFTSGTGAITTATYADVFAPMYELGTIVGAFFDGDSPTVTVDGTDELHRWTGTASASTSQEYRTSAAMTSSVDGARLLPGTVLANKLVIQDVTAAVGAIIKLDVSQLTVTGTSNFATAVVDKMFANIFAAHQVTADQIDAASVAAAVGTFVKVDANNVNFDEATGKVMTVGNAVLGDGIRTYATGTSGDEYVNVQLGVPGEADIVGVKDEDGNTVASMDGTGTVSGSLVQSDQDMQIAGNALVGTLIKDGADTDQAQRINWSPVRDFEDGSIGTPLNHPEGVAVSTDQAHSGTKSLKVIGPSSDNRVWWSVASSPLQVAVGDQITLSAWVYLPTATTAYAEVLYTGGTIVSQVKVSPNWSLRNQWQRVVSTSTVTTPAGTCLPAILMPTTAGQIIYVDDMQLEINGVATDFFSENTPATTDYGYKATTIGGNSVAMEYIPALPPGILDQFPRGVEDRTYTFRSVTAIGASVSQTTGALGQVNVTLSPNRTYELSMPVRVLPSKSTGSSATELVWSVRAWWTITVDGTEPPTPSASTSPMLADWSGRAYTARATGFSGILVARGLSTPASVQTRIKVLIGIYTDTGVTVTPTTYGPTDWIMTIEDKGPAVAIMNAADPGAGSVQRFVTTWTTTGSRTYRDDGSAYASDGSVNMRQGSDTGHVHVYWAAMVFNGNGTGSETKTIPVALNGATVEKVEVKLTLTYTEQAKGQAKVRPLNSKTIPSTLASPSASSKAYTTAPDIPRGSSAWFTVPSSYISTSNTGLILASPDWLFSNTHIVAGGAGAPASQRAQVRITYTRTI